MPNAFAKTRDMRQGAPIDADPRHATVRVGGRAVAVGDLDWDVPIDGTVYGTLLNYKGALAGLGEAVNAPPYKEAPKAPILYLKPPNTWIGYGRPIPLPADIEAIEIGAALGIVIGRTASRVAAADAFDYVRGYTIINDVTLPHPSVYRPPIRHRCRDGFCPIGPWVIDRDAVPMPDRLALRVFVNGALRAENNTANLVRPIAQLIAEVTDFMTLSTGDVLHVGTPEQAPLARLGDRVSVEIDGIGWLENPILAEAEALAGRLV
jgi:5-oxopent-3-ene-1,2,5-tricarboxylate decarboxylase / 2-hydroxyhepta-2,4-diene-1,7-dioate isomerase